MTRRLMADAGPFLDWDESRIASERIREMRAAAGVLQADLAAVLGITQAMLSRLEVGHCRWREADADKALVFLARRLEAKAAQAEGGEAA